MGEDHAIVSPGTASPGLLPNPAPAGNRPKGPEPRLYNKQIQVYAFFLGEPDC